MRYYISGANAYVGKETVTASRKQADGQQCAIPVTIPYKKLEIGEM